MHYINCDFFFIQDSEEEEVEEDSGVVEGEGEGSEVVGDSGGGNSIDNLPNILRSCALYVANCYVLY